MNKKQLMKFIRVAPNVRSLITFWYLPTSFMPIAMKSVTLLTADELVDNSIQYRIKVLHKKIRTRLVVISRETLNILAWKSHHWSFLEKTHLQMSIPTLHGTQWIQNLLKQKLMNIQQKLMIHISMHK